MIKYLSYAKLNLGLKVVGKREDGYHLLNSIFCRVSLYDEIYISLNESNQINILDHSQAWSIEDDLVYKAANKLKVYAKKYTGVNIRVIKNIPVGGGLGGGSSNAATMLLALNDLWECNLSKDELSAIGLSLGADVPFFIYETNALVSGIGEVVEPIELPKLYFLIIDPNIHVVTKEIFCNFRLQADKNIVNIDKMLELKHNDLEAVAFDVYPSLFDVYCKLKQYGSVHMSGVVVAFILHLIM